MVHGKNYETVFKLVKVMQRKLYYRLFFPDTVYNIISDQCMPSVIQDYLLQCTPVLGRRWCCSCYVGLRSHAINLTRSLQVAGVATQYAIASIISTTTPTTLTN